MVAEPRQSQAFNTSRCLTRAQIFQYHSLLCSSGLKEEVLMCRSTQEDYHLKKAISL